MIIANWEIVEELGEGGQGKVYKRGVLEGAASLKAQFSAQ